ncbi:MAG TPA: hypothetical protein VG273_06635 [Bryobacteraceae bacterium]|jgi:hypothetical protein|nr:hypothetical protein [Bryobacteraceae bacterium]
MKIIGIILLAAGFSLAQAPDPGYGTLSPQGDIMSERGLVDRTQQDLRRAADFERHHGHEKEVKRYEDAQHHLSDFDRRLTDGHFDKDKLDSAIDDVKEVVEHNTLDPAARDALRDDLVSLRQMRVLHNKD